MHDLHEKTCSKISAMMAAYHGYITAVQGSHGFFSAFVHEWRFFFLTGKGIVWRDGEMVFTKTMMNLLELYPESMLSLATPTFYSLAYKNQCTVDYYLAPVSS